MKNLKKLLAVVVTVALMATFMVPAFAAELTGDQKICKDLGMLKGGDAGFDSVYWAEETDRVTATLMYLRLLGEGDAAEAYANLDENFADAEDHVWGKKVLAYVFANRDRLGIVGVGGDNFEPNAIMDSKSYYKIMLNALGFEQDVDFTWGEVLDFAAKQGLTKIAAKDAITKDDISTATVEALKATVKDGDQTLIEKLVADGVITKQAAIAAGLIEDAPVAQAKAVGAKTFEVSFNKAVDTTKAAFAIKKGTITINTSKVEWNEAKTVATITLVSKITKGDYAITVSGVELPEGKDVLTVTAEDEKVAEIEITSDVAALTGVDSKEVLVYYYVKNQYGEDITKGTSLSWTSSQGTGFVDESTGVKKITGGNFLLNQTFTVTALHANTGTFATKVMKVGDISRVSKVTLGNLYNKDNKTLDTNSDYGTFYVELEAFDQYGNKVTNATQLTDQVTVVNTNPGVLGDGEFVASIGEGKGAGYKLAAAEADKTKRMAGKSTLYFYANISGQQSSIDINVEKVSSLDSLVLESPADIVVRGETVKIPFTAYDQNGVELSETAKADIADDVVKCSATGSTLKFSYNYETKKAELKLTIPEGSTLGTAMIMAVTPTGKVSQISVDVKDVAKPVAITGINKDIATLMTKGATSKIEAKNIVVADQYARAMTLDENWFKNDKANEGYKLEFKTSDNTKVSLGTTAIAAKGETIVMTGEAAGSAKITVSIIDKASTADDKTIANSAYEFTAQTVAKSAIAEYKVEAPEVLYTGGTVKSHDKALKVYGLTSGGAKIALVAPEVGVDSDFVVTTNDEKVVYADGKLGAEGAIESDKDVEKTVTVLVVTTDKAPQTITNTVTITNKKPVLTTVYAETDDENIVKVSKDMAYVKTNTGLTADNLKNVIKGKDQYGVKLDSGDTTWKVTNILITNITGDVKVTGNGTDAPTFTGAKAGDTFTATFITNTSLTKEINVVVEVDQ